MTEQFNHLSVKRVCNERMAEATKGYPTAVLVKQNYSQSFRIYFAPHA